MTPNVEEQNTFQSLQIGQTNSKWAPILEDNRKQVKIVRFLFGKVLEIAAGVLNLAWQISERSKKYLGSTKLKVFFLISVINIIFCSLSITFANVRTFLSLSLSILFSIRSPSLVSFVFKNSNVYSGSLISKRSLSSHAWLNLNANSRSAQTHTHTQTHNWNTVTKHETIKNSDLFQEQFDWPEETLLWQISFVLTVFISILEIFQDPVFCWLTS